MRYFTCLKHARAIEGFRGCNFNVFRTVLSSDGQPPPAAGAGHPPHHRWAFRADPHPIIAGFGRDVVGYAVDNGDPDHDAARDVGEHKRSTRHHASIDPHAERGATAVAPCIGQATSASIHAPARGATVKVYIRMQIKLICYASLKLPRHPARKTSPKNAYKPREPTGSTSSLQVRAGQSKPKCIKVLRGHTHHHGPTAPRAPSSSFPDYKSASYPYRRQ